MAQRKTELKIGAGRIFTLHSFLRGSCDFFVGTQSIFAMDSALDVRKQAQLAVVPLASMGELGNNRQGRRHDSEEIALRIRAASR